MPWIISNLFFVESHWFSSLSHSSQSSAGLSSCSVNTHRINVSLTVKLPNCFSVVVLWGNTGPWIHRQSSHFSTCMFEILGMTENVKCLFALLVLTTSNHLQFAYQVMWWLTCLLWFLFLFIKGNDQISHMSMKLRSHYWEKKRYKIFPFKECTS